MAMTLHFENKELDFDYKAEEELIQRMKDILEGDNTKYVPYYERFVEFQDALKEMCKLFDEYNIYVKKASSTPDGWFIIVKSKNSLTMQDTHIFVKKVLRNADNFEIASDLNGNIDFSVGFYGMVKGAF